MGSAPTGEQVPHPPRCRCPEHGEWVAAGDVNRMARELDVAWNGEAGAARAPALCDVVGQVLSDLRSGYRASSAAADARALVLELTSLDAARARWCASGWLLNDALGALTRIGDGEVTGAEAHHQLGMVEYAMMISGLRPWKFPRG